MSLDATLNQLIPHGYCLSWNPRLLGLHMVSDGVTALSYATIPVMLLKLVRERKDLQFSWVFVLFGAFILACGATHALSLWTIWHPDYLMAGLVKALTAAVSVGTALALWPLVPKAIALPGPAQWEAVHADLRGQVAERRRAEDEVRRLNAQLEDRVRERTAALEDANARLSALHAELELRVQDRTRELERAQAALVDSARQAGKAEIATNVLHNVGNVLNSLNVSMNLVGQRLRQSRLPGLGKACALLEEHRTTLPAFLAEDPKGRLLPDYLRQLDQALVDEQREVQTEVAQVIQGIDHLKGIVATQQSYAGGHVMRTPTDVATLVADALRLNAGSLQRHQVVVQQDIAVLPDFPLDRHRTLQILVNLIANAKQAMDTAQARGHHLRIQARQADDGALHLSVQDEGDGIEPEHLDKIFAHGFTTRAQGHGFGLHSCVMAAQEMGGELRVHSAGRGQGATFTLVVPA